MSILNANLALIILIFSTGYAAAKDIPDTYENRREAALRHLVAVPTENMINDAAQEMAKNMPENNRSFFLAMMTEVIRIDVLEKATIEAMTKHFSVQEIDAMTEFYTSTHGSSVMKKFGLYTAEIIPTVQQEVIRAVNIAIESIDEELKKRE